MPEENAVKLSYRAEMAFGLLWGKHEGHSSKVAEGRFGRSSENCCLWRAPNGVAHTCCKQRCVTGGCNSVRTPEAAHKPRKGMIAAPRGLLLRQSCL